MWKFLSHFPLRLSLSYPFFYEVWDRALHLWRSAAGPPGGPGVWTMVSVHPGSETSLISIPAWHTPDKSCPLITTERVREAKVLWGVSCKKGRKARYVFYLNNKIHLVISILMIKNTHHLQLPSPYFRTIKALLLGNVHAGSISGCSAPLSHHKYRTSCGLFHCYYV